MTEDAADATPRRLRVGVAGLGAVAQAVHLPLLDRLDDRFEIAAVADLSRSLLDIVGERYRVPAARRHLSLEGLLEAGSLDAILILTSGSHGSAILAALERGLPVFVEKPLAYTLAEADAIGARLAAMDPPGRLQVGYMKLHDPAVIRALASLREPAGGDIRSIDVTVLHPTSENQLAHAHLHAPADVADAVVAPLRDEVDRLRAAALGPSAGEAIGQLYSSVLLGSVVHDLALTRAFAGDPVAIDFVDVWPAGAWPPSVGIAGRLASGGRLTIRWHFLPEYPAYREEFRVIRENASIELEFPSPYLLHAPTRLTITDADGGARRDTNVSSVVEAFEEELLAFHAFAADGTPPPAGLAEGRADIVTCQQIAARYAATLGIEIGGEAAGIAG